MISATTDMQLKEMAREVAPREMCALLFAAGEVVVPLTNAALDPESDFEVPPSEIDAAIERHGAPYAFVHSHTNGKRGPSKKDMVCQQSWRIPFGIVPLMNGGAYETTWWGDGVPTAPLLEREFIFGVHDCFALVRDWYQVEHGIKIPDVPREDNFWDDHPDGSPGESIFREHFLECGFVLVDEIERPGDVLVGKFRSKVESHCGLYIGDNLLLHHPPHALSRTDILNRWLKFASMVCRHKELM